MNDKPNNPQAFPTDQDYLRQFGMTLRDYFAAKAMVVLLADARDTEQVGMVSGNSYKIADAMLKEREL